MYRRRMHAEGGRVVHREKRTRKLAVVVALQNLLVTACLLVTIYVYCYRDTQISDDNIHIGFQPIGDITGNRTLNFNVESSNMMELRGKDKILINCTGPYILYMEVCYRPLERAESKGILQLRVEGNDTPVSSITMNASQNVCRGLHSIGYLKAGDVADLYLNSTKHFKIKNVTVGLRYLLGRCEV